MILRGACGGRDYLVSVDDIEKQTGYDFLRELPDDVENIIEAKVPTPQECGGAR
jgi:endonuclease G, mitochondrial